MGIGEEEIKYVREIFERKYADCITEGLYDQRDVDRFRTDDVFVRTYIRGPTRLDEGVDLVHESFRFRKEMEVNDIQASDFEQSVWDKKGMFLHNRDKTGHKILFICIKEHRRDASLLPGVKKFYLFWLEKAFREAPLEKIVTIFDMTSCGLSNLDMELTRFILNCYKFYYPTILERLLIYEMPWVFNAAWRIIKTWLSAEAISKIKFVTKLDIQDYISADQLPVYMGGTDTFDTVGYCCLEPAVASESPTTERKRVTFSETSSLFRSFSKEKMEANVNDNYSGTKDGLHNPAPSSDKNSSFVGYLLTISPAEELVFSDVSSGHESFDIITLTNTMSYPVAFKIKTTSPEKYRVHPSIGLVKAGHSHKVYVYLQPGFPNSMSKDKFLVMAAETTGTEYEPSIWKTVPEESIMQHRLRCTTTGNRNESQMVNFSVAYNGDKHQSRRSRDDGSKAVSSSPNPISYSSSPRSNSFPRGNATVYVETTDSTSSDLDAAIQNIKRLSAKPNYNTSPKPNTSISGQLEMLLESNRQLRRRMNWLITMNIIFFVVSLAFFGALLCQGDDYPQSFLYPFGCMSSSCCRRYC